MKDHKSWADLPLTLSLAQFCSWTGLSRNTVQKLAREGALATTLVGQRRRYLKVEVARIAGLPWRA